MTPIEHFENNVFSVFSVLKENFDSLSDYTPSFGLDTDITSVPDMAIDNFDSSIEDKKYTDITSAPLQDEIQTVVPVEKPPRFRVYWRAWKEGNNTSGETESVLETSQMARAEAMSKLYDLGFADIEILAIETIKQTESITV